MNWYVLRALSLLNIEVSAVTEELSTANTLPVITLPSSQNISLNESSDFHEDSIFGTSQKYTKTKTGKYLFIQFQHEVFTFFYIYILKVLRLYSMNLNKTIVQFTSGYANPVRKGSLSRLGN